MPFLLSPPKTPHVIYFLHQPKALFKNKNFCSCDSLQLLLAAKKMEARQDRLKLTSSLFRCFLLFLLSRLLVLQFSPLLFPSVFRFSSIFCCPFCLFFLGLLSLSPRLSLFSLLPPHIKDCTSKPLPFLCHLPQQGDTQAEGGRGNEDL